MTSRIVVLDGYTLNPGDNPWDQLTKLGHTTIHDRTSPEEIIRRSEDASVLVVNKVRIGSEQIANLPNLRFIAVTATGFDCVDSAAARECGIPVSNVPVYGTDSVAQHVFASLFHIIHRIDDHDQAIRNGHWTQTGDFSFWLHPLCELRGKTMGIVGFGRIGRRVVEIANVFGMRVLAHSRRRTESTDGHTFEWGDLSRIQAESDVISLHCPLTDATRGMIDQDFLAACNPKAILINTGRGPLVVEQDLAAALNAGQIRSRCIGRCVTRAD